MFYHYKKNYLRFRLNIHLMRSFTPFLLFSWVMSYGLVSPAGDVANLSIDGEIITNICADQRGKPYKSYSGFGFDKNGKFYGLKGSSWSLIPLTQDLVVKSSKSEVEGQEGAFIIDKEKTVYNFFQKTGITEENCSPSEGLPSHQVNHTQKNSNSSGGQGGKKDDSSCKIAGLADSYVLAMSWQPAFCLSKQGKEGQPGKPECGDADITSPESQSSNNFSLHGLWPNKEGCGVEYGFCGKAHKQQAFSSYPAVVLTEDTFKFLEPLMPSLKAKSYLERHEWHKHGTCHQKLTEVTNSNLTSEEREQQEKDIESQAASRYFNLAGKLVNEFNSYKFMDLFREGKRDGKIDFNTLKGEIDSEQGLGPGTSQSLIFICKKSPKTNNEPYLVEIQVNLIKDLDENSTLKDSIDRTKRGYNRGCVKKQKVSRDESLQQDNATTGNGTYSLDLQHTSSQQIHIVPYPRVDQPSHEEGPLNRKELPQPEQPTGEIVAPPIPDSALQPMAS